MTINNLIESATRFCEIESRKNHIELIGITDGKAVGTYVEHKFQHFLQSQYIVDVGSSAKGIDVPGAEIQTDIKVTSMTQPQSSCPFENARSNELQWRLQYARVITLNNSVQGVVNYAW